ncbi:tyrosine-type recombinase/integrase [Paracoccus sp. YLB-12]|uniref:Tyrosine-type recombinase/integrase n=1 Tax=Paracoccus maritimus TaxID=2933292 RepID=A0ABT2KB25_9RHOB|nr:tyrosine-type recombinase/integrase [Paracoccus sp. YLB-12]MCT4333194.1 tyrosine-type recombinase/integrase [Paracoccus sp. YLB-12]
MTIVARGKKGKLSLMRRVPLRYASVESRKLVWVALNTDSRALAESKAGPVWDAMIEGWEAKLAGDSADAERRFSAAQELAEMRGFRYAPMDKVSELPLDELLRRIESVSEDHRTRTPDLRESAALLGAVNEPGISISRALEIYWDLARGSALGKSQDQRRRWRNPRIKAVKNFIDVVGDKFLADITPDDMLDFRSWWMDRIEAGEVGANSANKDLIHLGDILKTVVRMKRLPLTLTFDGLSFREGEARQRPSFSDSWIKEKLLADGALDSLNDEAKAVLLAMINTGARPSEIANLGPGHIFLDAGVPHISIAAEGRQLKSAYAKRVIPLSGVSLNAMRQHPSGFPRYRDKPGLSATVNKFLRANGLLETKDHSLYGLRRSFEDRMLAAGVDDRIRRDLFGHRLDRERYGKGASLEHLQRVVQAVAF